MLQNNFDTELRLYTNSTPALMNPKQPDKFMPQAFATRDPLPTLKDHEVAQRNVENTKWNVVEDYRGSVWDTATKSERGHKELGPLPDHLTNKEPGPFDSWDGSDWVYNIQLEIAVVLPAIIEDINSACKAAIEGGFISNALGQDCTYDSELEDQVNIGGNVQMGIDVLHKRIDSNGDAAYVTHSAAEMRLVGEHLVAHKLAQLTKAGNLKAQAAAAAAAGDLAALQAITWS